MPSNIGPLTTPEYEKLAAQGIYTDAASGIRVFAGQRAETFAIDLGAVFDTLNLLLLKYQGQNPDPNVGPFSDERLFDLRPPFLFLAREERKGGGLCRAVHEPPLLFAIQLSSCFV